MWPNPEETADLVTFPEEILNGKFHFLHSVISVYFDSASVQFTRTLCEMENAKNTWMDCE